MVGKAPNTGILAVMTAPIIVAISNRARLDGSDERKNQRSEVKYGVHDGTRKSKGYGWS